MDQMNLHIIGLGNLGMSFLGGFKSINSDLNLNLYESNEKTRDLLIQDGWENVYSSIESISDGIILLCIKPNDLNDFIIKNKEKIHSDVLICSSLAGVSVKTFESEFENRIIRLMPNLAIKQKSGFIPFTRNYTDDYLNFVEILNTLGSTQEYDESLFHIITAIYGSGPAWYFELSAKIVNSAVNLGMDESDAKILVSNLLSSLPHLTGEKDFDEIVENIKSPKGTTEAGINSLENNSFDKIIYEAIESAVERSIEISKAMENE